MTKKTLLAGGLAALSLAVAGAAALAQQQPTSPAPTPHGPRAARDDADGDGRVSRAEFVDARLSRLTAADADHNGTVTPEERHAAMQAHRAERSESGRPHRGERTHRPMSRHMNRDGGPVVIAEARVKIEEGFARLDADRDGYLSADERRVGMERMHERRQERREVRGAPRAPQASPSAPASE